MRFRFVAFDRRTINEEFLKVPWPDHAILAQAMASYQRLGAESSRAQVAKYANQVWRLKPSDGSSGRCLFVPIKPSARGVQRLLVLAVYKKEGDDVPRSAMKRAERRLREWQSE